MSAPLEKYSPPTWADYAKAFAIFAKYGDGAGKTQARHDELLAGPDPELVSAEDCAQLEALGWGPDEESGECWYRFT